MADVELTVTLGRLPPEGGALADLVREELARRLNAALPAYRQRVGDALEAAVRGRPETASLLERDSSGAASLREHLGLAEPEAAVAALVLALRESLEAQVRYAKGAGNELGRLTLEILRDDFEEVLTLHEASYQNPGKRGGTIAWLSWLLFKGSEIIVLGSKFKLLRGTRRGSRTGRAVMVTPNVADASEARRRRWKQDYVATPAVWSIPAAWAGTADANFLTRAMEDASAPIEHLTEDFFRSVGG